MRSSFSSYSLAKINRAWSEVFTCDQTVQRLFLKFHIGDTSLKDQGGIGCPSAIDNEHVRTLAEHKAILDHLGGNGKKLDKLISYELTDSQKVRKFETDASSEKFL